MKVLFACFLIIATAQAVDWSRIRPIFRTQPTLKHTSNGKIIGGSMATPGQFPYQVGIFIDGSGFCGGSLISDSFVMTAAHCVDGYTSFEIHLGAQNIYNESEPNRKIVNSFNGIAHENYNSNNINNDIAVIKLFGAVSGPGISPVRVPSRSQVGESFDGERVRVSGWGRTGTSAGISEELMFVDVTVIPNSECDNYYLGINDSKICTATNGGDEGTCNGDSGGPLVVTESDGEVTEIGIVSFGSSFGCQSGFPAAFTRVSEYLDWLEKNAEITIRP